MGEVRPLQSIPAVGTFIWRSSHQVNVSRRNRGRSLYFLNIRANTNVAPVAPTRLNHPSSSHFLFLIIIQDNLSFHRFCYELLHHQVLVLEKGGRFGCVGSGGWRSLGVLR
jgi:hypothetical protein